MTSDREIIKAETGCEIGKVYLRGSEGKAEEKEYDVCKDGNYIYDLKSGNFHLLPEFTHKDDAECWRCFFDVTKSLRERIIVILEKELNKKHSSNKVDLLSSAEFKRINKDDTGMYIGNEMGKVGTLGGIPQKYRDMGLNQFFRFIPVFLNGRYFTLNFMRFYLDKEGGIPTVNCVYGEFQFDSTKNLCVNSKDKSGKSKNRIRVRYPDFNAEFYKRDEADKSGVIMCNPDIENIWEVSRDDEKIKNLVKKFIKFMAQCFQENPNRY